MTERTVKRLSDKIGRIEAWGRGEEAVVGPSFLQIEPSGECNLRCQMCLIQFRRDGPPYGPPALLEWDLFTRILDNFPTARQLHLQGMGEPLLHPRFFEMVQYAVAHGLEVTTSSNLTLLTPERVEACIASGLHTLHVSIDAAQPHVYEKIRVNAHWKQVVGNLERLLTARARHGGGRPRVHIVAVLMRENIDELEDLIWLAHRWAVEELFVQHLCHNLDEPSLPVHYKPLRDFIRAQSLQDTNPIEVLPFLDQAAALARELGMPLRLPRLQPYELPADASGRERCNWPWRGMYISYRGEAMPCCMVGTPDRISLGSVAAEGAAVWTNPAYQEFRSQLTSPAPPTLCRSCSIYQGTF